MLPKARVKAPISSSDCEVGSSRSKSPVAIRPALPASALIGFVIRLESPITTATSSSRPVTNRIGLSPYDES